jgi:hypothetical protein
MAGNSILIFDTQNLIRRTVAPLPSRIRMLFDDSLQLYSLP